MRISPAGHGKRGGVKGATAGALRWPPVGRIAQVVEQLTLNQRVVGSSPTAPTNLFNELQGFA